MYKDRVRLWRLNKNNKASEIQAALRLALERERSRLTPVSGFQLGSRYVTSAEIDRYLRRKRIKNPREWAVENQQMIDTQTLNPSTDLGLMYAQSERSPAPTNIEAYSAMNPIFSPIIPFSLAPGQEDLTIQMVLRAIHAYRDSKCHLLRNIEGRSLCDYVMVYPEESHWSLFIGLANLRMRRYKHAGSCFNQTFSSIKSLLQQDDVHMLRTIFGHMMILAKAGVRDLTFQFLSYLASMSTIVLGQQHPVSVVANILLKSPPQLLHHVIKLGIRSLWLLTQVFIHLSSGPSVETDRQMWIEAVKLITSPVHVFRSGERKRLYVKSKGIENNAALCLSKSTDSPLNDYDWILKRE